MVTVGSLPARDPLLEYTKLPPPCRSSEPWAGSPRQQHGARHQQRDYFARRGLCHLLVSGQRCHAAPHPGEESIPRAGASKPEAARGRLFLEVA